MDTIEFHAIIEHEQVIRPPSGVTLPRGEIEVKVVDSGYAQMLIAPWSMFLVSGYSRESSDGYEKSVTVAGQPGFERWNKDNKRGELNIVAGKRFLVTIEGDELADTKVLHEFASKMDLNRIAGLK